MEANELTIKKQDVQKLVAAGSGDAALLYLYLCNGGCEADAPSALNLLPERIAGAMSLLRRVGLVAEHHRFIQSEERPVYSERDVLAEDDKQNGFPELRLELESRYGKKFTVPDLKSLLTMRNYLNLPDEVIIILFSYCLERNRNRGNVRLPAMRIIEQEAFRWADDGIDTMEEAVSYVRQELGRQQKYGPIRRALQINNRRLSPGEEKYIARWLDMGFGEREIALAYDRTCLHSGSMNWNYMNAILCGWQKKNLFTAEEIEQKDKAPARPAGQAGGQKAGNQPENNEITDPMLLAAIRRRMNRGEDN